MKSMRPLRILVSGGGTAGHVFPVLAVVRALQQELARKHQAAELTFVGRRASVEEAIVRQAGIPYVGITAGKLRRYAHIQNIIDPFRIMLGFFQALGLLLKFRPDVVFVKGGFVSVPVTAAAWLLKIPLVAHETDAVLGLSNRLAEKVARVICTSYPVDVYHGVSKNKLMETGNPVRSEFFAIKQQNHTKPPYTLVVVGGSQGALAINRAMGQLIQHPIRGLAILHVTGPAHYDSFSKQATTFYHPIAYADTMANLLSQADLVISRAGGSIFELAAAARPAVLIPISVSANNHQETNAAFFSNHDAAVIVHESELSSESLRAIVQTLLKDTVKRRQLSVAIGKLAKPNAATNVATEILKAVPSSRLH